MIHSVFLGAIWWSIHKVFFWTVYSYFSFLFVFFPLCYCHFPLILDLLHFQVNTYLISGWGSHARKFCESNGNVSQRSVCLRWLFLLIPSCVLWDTGEWSLRTCWYESTQTRVWLVLTQLTCYFWDWFKTVKFSWNAPYLFWI